MREFEIEAYVNAEPFIPFRIHVSDGSSYEITGRQHVIIRRTRVVIGLDEDETGLPRASVLIDPVHITRLQAIMNARAGASS